MSTTDSIHTALKYGATGAHCVLFKLKTGGAMQRGANLTFLSAFPGEREYLFRPLVFLKPVGQPQRITLAGRGITVVEVEPQS